MLLGGPNVVNTASEAEASHEWLRARGVGLWKRCQLQLHSDASPRARPRLRATECYHHVSASYIHLPVLPDIHFRRAIPPLCPPSCRCLFQNGECPPPAHRQLADAWRERSRSVHRISESADHSSPVTPICLLNVRLKPLPSFLILGDRSYISTPGRRLNRTTILTLFIVALCPNDTSG